MNPAELIERFSTSIAQSEISLAVPKVPGRDRDPLYTILAHCERTRYARRPLLAAALVVSFLSFVGIPPLAGFAAKLALFGATVEAGYGWLAILAVINTVISLAYYARILGPVYFSVPTGEARRATFDARELGSRWRITQCGGSGSARYRRRTSSCRLPRRPSPARIAMSHVRYRLLNT